MSWASRAAWCASQIVDGPLSGLVGARSAEGTSPEHFRWMADELAARRVEGDTKACRWLGYLQAGLVLTGLSTLEAEKARNLRSAEHEMD